MNRFFLLVCLVVCLLAGTEAALDAEGIVGGEVAPRDEYTYQISLQTEGRGFCGGSIIGDQHVLTAAHCVTNSWGVFSTFPMQVVAGVFDLDRKGSDAITIDVEKIYIPKEYGDITDVNDIAIIKLKEPLGLDENSDRISKLELPEAGNSYAGEEATVTGYGWSWVKLQPDPWTGELTETGGVVTHKKKFAITDVLTTEECQKNYTRPITQKEICARVQQRGDKTEGVCSGDSGGPLVYDGSVVIGVVSTSPLGCDESKASAIYTRVSEFLDFINNAVADRVDSSMRVYEPKKSGRRTTKKPWLSFLSKLSI